MKNKIATIIATWFGVGFSPIMSGTMGSLVALPFAWAIQTYMGDFALPICTIILFPIGWWATKVYIQTTGKHDPKEIVVDEVVGQWLLLSVFVEPKVCVYFLAFVLFRFFDILKPYPVSIPDKKMDNALGVMLDDVFAGLYPFAIFTFAVIIFGLFGKADIVYNFIDLLL